MDFKRRGPLLAAAVAVLTAATPVATAQDDDGSLPAWYFGPLFGYVVPEDARDVDYGINLHAILGFQVADSVGIEFNAFGQQSERTSDDRRDYSYGGGIDLALGTPLPGNLLFLIGGGAIYEDIKTVSTETSGFANLGIGGYLPFTLGGELWRVEARYNAIFNDESLPPNEILEDVRLNVGVLFGFGYPKPVEAEPAPPAPEPTVPMADEDGDGVPDADDRCPDTPRWVRPDENGCTPDEDGDGVPVDRDCCPQTPPGVAVDDQGCPLKPEPAPEADEDGDGVPNSRDKCPHTPPGYEVDENGCVKVQEVVLENIHFELDSDALTSVAYRILNSVAASIRQQRRMVVEVAGHADSTGAAEYNVGLSQRRASVVRDFLIYLGVPSERLIAIGHGESQPVADNATEAGRAKNRRVEFRILSR